MTELTAADLHAAQGIADWNNAHGAVLARVTAACNALGQACGAASSSPSEASYSAVRTAGRDLAATAVGALRGPWAGVPQYDEPRRLALECYRQAGELASAWAPAGDVAERAAALLVKGTELTSQATGFATGLVERLTR